MFVLSVCSEAQCSESRLALSSKFPLDHMACNWQTSEWMLHVWVDAPHGTCVLHGTKGMSSLSHHDGHNSVTKPLIEIFHLHKATNTEKDAEKDVDKKAMLSQPTGKGQHKGAKANKGDQYFGKGRRQGFGKAGKGARIW